MSLASGSAPLSASLATGETARPRRCDPQPATEADGLEWNAAGPEVGAATPGSQLAGRHGSAVNSVEKKTEGRKLSTLGDAPDYRLGPVNSMVSVSTRFLIGTAPIRGRNSYAEYPYRRCSLTVSMSTHTWLLRGRPATVPFYWEPVPLRMRHPPRVPVRRLKQRTSNGQLIQVEYCLTYYGREERNEDIARR